MTSNGSAPHVLFVCEGNICRSPYAMVSFSESWAAAGHGPVTSSSAGTRAPAGAGAHDELGRFFEDPGSTSMLAAHRSRPLDADLVRIADVVITMERRQRTDVLALVPRALRRTYMLHELALVAAAVRESSTSPDGASLADLTGRFRFAARDARDVADPIKGSAGDFADMAHDIDRSLHQVVPLLASVLAGR
ncbi:hypothetical protein [Curtobacterium sp. HSID17257]|uniref:arsenate reductase/protein-tyrosine-phosphatase family protein n=1 Tax=Curtobacterium sp. HSID17257 TaxID=2419510 RepID=UPI000F8659D0|nr:hypothetical protein [Curtobacterium sp. HSID17257]RUQ05250.1 hypothetical protein D8M35_08705 [Curtobacterium sp. HSID17257]